MKLIPSNIFAALIVVTSCVWVGCQKPGPIELQDPEQSQISELEPVPDGAIFEHEPDSTGLIGVDRERYFAEFVVSGVRFDGPNQSHTVSLARAVLYDKTRPIEVGTKRIGYQTLDAGTVLIDGLPLHKLTRRFQDSTAGPYYILVRRNGSGGRGFEYLPSHRYEWTNIGPSSYTINFQALSAEAIRVTRPVPQDIVSQRRDLIVEWEGGEKAVTLIVSVPLADGRARPTLRMVLRSERKRILIPSKVLELLPVDRSARFVFSFVSRRSAEAQLGGYPDKALVHSAFIHNLILTVQR